MSFEFTFQSLLDLLALVQGILLGLLLINRSNDKRPTVFLGLFLISYSGDLVVAVLEQMWLTEEPMLPFTLPLHFLFLTAPLFYIYTRILTGHLTSTKTLLLLLPGIVEFVVVATLSLLIHNRVIDQADELLLMRIFANYWIAGLVFSLVFLILTINVSVRHRKQLGDYFSRTEGRKLRWIEVLGYMMVALILGWFSLTVLNFPSGVEWPEKLLSTFNALIIFAIALYGIQQQIVSFDLDGDEGSKSGGGLIARTKNTEDKYWSESNHGEIETTLEADPEKDLTALNQSQTAKDSAVYPEVEDQDSIIFNRLLALMNKQKPHLDNDLQLHQISILLGVPARKVSQSIKKNVGMNFNGFINQYRIEDAQRMLLSEEGEQYNMLGIALEVGFNSKATFYATFKKLCHCNPSEYKKKMQNSGHS